MGVQLGDLVQHRKVELTEISGKTVAIDAYNMLYQFLSIIRGADGTPLKDRSGRVTSHLSGLFYRTANLVEAGIKPVYVFDGKPPALKEEEIRRRISVKKVAAVKYEKALKLGKIEEAKAYAQATSRLEDYMVNGSKSLLALMGVPWVQAPSEGEAQAAYMAMRGDVWAAASQDYDALLFGAPRLIRNLSITGRRKLPRKNVYVEVKPEIVELNRVLEELAVTREQLVTIGILIGTDFNPDGVEGIGPKTALTLTKKHGRLENILPNLKKAEFPVEPKRIAEIFLDPEITPKYVLDWKSPDVEGTLDFLCKDHDFSRERVLGALEKMNTGLKEAEKKSTLEKWFSPN